MITNGAGTGCFVSYDSKYANRGGNGDCKD